MAIAACFVFQREISRSVFWDFFDSIDPDRTPCLVGSRSSRNRFYGNGLVEPFRDAPPQRPQLRQHQSFLSGLLAPYRDWRGWCGGHANAPCDVWVTVGPLMRCLSVW